MVHKSGNYAGLDLDYVIQRIGIGTPEYQFLVMIADELIQPVFRGERIENTEQLFPPLPDAVK